MSPLSWFENQWRWLEGREELSLHSWRAHTQTCLLPGPVQRQQIENCLVLRLACWDHPRMLPSSHWAPAPAPPAPVLLLSKVGTAIAILRTHAHRKSGAGSEGQLQSTASQPSLWLRWRLPSFRGESFSSPSGPPRGGWLPSLRESPVLTWLCLCSSGCQHTPKEDVFCAHFRSSSPTKAAGHMQAAPRCSHTRMQFQHRDR